MDSAQDRVTAEIVEAEQLWLIENVDNERYICRGCGIKVIPKSYDPDNILRPHFAKPKGISHKPGCDVDGEGVLVKAGRTKRLSTAREGFPAPYPSRLVLIDERPVVDSGTPEDDEKKGSRNGQARSRTETGNSPTPRKITANTIRPICRTFIRFPYDRDLDLSIPGITPTNYLTVFKKLKWDELCRYPEARIFYSPILWKKATETEEYLEVLVDAGEREDKKLTNGNRVRIEWADWSKAKRTYVRNELEAARKEAMYAKGKDSTTKIKSHLFFIGEQDVSDLALFRIFDHRLICCLVDEISYPKLG